MDGEEWFLLLEPQGRRVLPHPGKVSPFGPSSQPSPSFLGVHLCKKKKKKSIPPAKLLRVQCVSTRTRRVRVCVPDLSPKQLLFFDCPTSILCARGRAALCTERRSGKVAAVVDGRALACTSGRRHADKGKYFPCTTCGACSQITTDYHNRA